MTASERKRKLETAVVQLTHALEFEKQMTKDTFYFYGISKTFEVCLEYAWKYLKLLVSEEGVEALSPRQAIKEAGRLGLIDNVESWLSFLKDRNLAVHDYFSVEDDDYLATIKEFLKEVKKLPS